MRAVRVVLTLAWMILSGSHGAAAVPCDCTVPAFWALPHTPEEVERFKQEQIQQLFESSGAVFVGRADRSADFSRTVVEVDRVWKGDLPRHVRMNTGTRQIAPGLLVGWNCAYSPPRVWSVIFASRAPNGDVASGVCRPNTPLADAADLIERLNRIAAVRAPREETPTLETFVNAPGPAPTACFTSLSPPTISDLERDGDLRREVLTAFRRAQAIFIGTALSSSLSSTTFEVTRVWQGELPKLLTLRGPAETLPDGTQATTSEVARDFKIGTSYLVEAFGSSLQDARPNACSTAPETSSRTAISILDLLVKSYPPRTAQ